jgi:hypothetical protein
MYSRKEYTLVTQIYHELHTQPRPCEKYRTRDMAREVSKTGNRCSVDGLLVEL